jgi:LCP family protein required for cell wall assembly
MGEDMTDTRSPDELGQADGVPGSNAAPPRRRHGLRIILLSLASVTVLLGAAAAGAFFYVNHEVGSIPRIPVKFLAQDDPSTGMTILLTDLQVGPTGYGSATQAVNSDTGLIMLLHLNANQTSGGVVSISPLTEVNVPGQGEMPIEEVVSIGGPSLLAETVHDLTGVPLNHYARIDFTHVDSVVNAVGGVSVTLPETTQSFGYVFQKGVNHINGAEAVAYTRDPSLTEAGRVLRQQSITRAILGKIASDHLLTSPLTAARVLSALTGLLTLDSNFTNSEILSLTTHLSGLAGRASVFVTAPTKTVDGSVVLNPAESSAIWSAIKDGTIAAFAKKYPATVTPPAP